jgi:hypothetical protein
VLIEQEDAMNLVGRHFTPFYGFIDGAWQDYLTYPIDKRIVHSLRSRASLVHDHMVDRATKYAAIEDDVRVVNVGGLYLFVVGGKMAIRLKKFDKELKTRNQPTGQVDRFKGQEQLPGVEAAHNLEAGYILSADAQSLAAVHLVCPSGTGIYWDILLTAQSQTSVIEDLFAKKIANDVADEGAKVRRREIAKIVQIKRNDS